MHANSRSRHHIYYISRHLFKEGLYFCVRKFLRGSGLHNAVAEGRDQLGRLELAHVAVHQLHEGVLQRSLEYRVTLTARRQSQRHTEGEENDSIRVGRTENRFSVIAMYTSCKASMS